MMNNATCPFLQWEALVYSASSKRYQPHQDQAFWKVHAARYDAQQPSLPHTIAWLKRDLSDLDTLLEMGAGTGRLLLPLSDSKKRVTALDYSAEMLQVLRGKSPPPQVQLRCGTLDDLQPKKDQHSASLCAWSLAYQADIRRTLTHLKTLTTERIYLLEDNGIGSPHVNLRRALTAHPRPRRADLLVQIVKALGWSFESETITETRTLLCTSPEELLTLARLPLPRSEALHALAPYLHETATGICYTWSFDVHIIRITS